MEVDADHSSIPIVDLSEKMKTLQCEESDGTIRSCAYLKNGKLDFYEPKLLLENHMLIAQKIIFFRDFRYKLETTHDLHTDPLEIPPAYLDVIASSLYALTSRVNDLLSPYGRDESLSHKFESAIQKAIEQVATRVKYGLSKEVYKSIKNTTDKMPWHLYIYRWEVKDMNFFPPEIQQAVLARKKKRMEMSEEVSNYIKSLPIEESLGLINAKHRRTDNNEKWSAKIEKERQQREEDKKKWEDEKKRRQEEQRQREEEKKKKREEEKKLKEEQKIKREEEKKLKEEQKKKREDDKKKKEQSQLRLTSLFTKAAPNENTIPEKIVEPSKPTLFPPFYVKDNVTITENTTFDWPSPSSDTDDFVNKIRSPSNNINIHTFLSELPSEAKQKRGFTPSIDIRTLLLPGSADLLNTPHVRMTLRMKLLQFTEDVRPAYYGTFTQKSSVITGKTPFAQDTSNFDYEVDSEAEWEPEGEGEEINSGDEDEEEVSDYVDPEDSGWVVPEGYLSDNEGVEGEHDQLNKPRTTNAPKKKATKMKQ
ncbi:hypothetical protein G6F70_008880 [Rhizopus microsporus]|nr:hypothetical protein G6F70_008880 [Rhizopus microsporus]KAG1258434.1 hypothetical protein G6F68_008769 [Rhizopus microsporus]